MLCQCDIFFKSLSQGGHNTCHIYISDFLYVFFLIIVEFCCWYFVCDTLKIVILRFSMRFFLHYKHVMKFFKNLVRVLSGINSLHCQFGT